ncbi:MAG: ABC transporter ATP-binding protein [Bacilli bacterium]
MDNDEIFTEETDYNKKYSVKDFLVMKSFAKYVKPYLITFIILLVSDIFVNLLFNLEPLVFSFIIDDLTDFQKGLISLENAVPMMILFICLDTGFWFFGSIGGFFVNYGLRKAGQKVIRDFRIQMFEHVLSLSQKQMKTLKIGSFVTRVTNDTQNLSSFFSDLLPNFLRQILTLIVIISASFFRVGVYGCIFLAFLPIVFVLSYFFRKKARVYYRQEKKSVSQMNSFLSESFSGIKVIKTYNREDKKALEFDEKNHNIFSSFLHSQNLFALYYPFMYFLQMTCLLIIVGFGVPGVISGAVAIGSFTLLCSYSSQFFQPVQQITQLLNSLQAIMSSAERTKFVMDMNRESDCEEGKLDVERFNGKIEFQHVYFKYEDGLDYVLKDVSFVIYPGKTVAFVGATGAGKSTIISLISRIYSINSGKILIDDVDVNDYSLKCLRRNVGVMLQDVFLFSGSIKESISLNDPKVSDEKVIEASKEVGADTFIDRLPHKYDEKITERGNNFSAGQRQLISFARTLVYKPSLVLLDEATANIDTETENIIQSSLEKMRSIGTMIIVAHRLSTIKNADHIFVVSKGQIIEEGNHQELLKMKKNYYNLYRLQNLERTIDKKEAI